MNPKWFFAVPHLWRVLSKKPISGLFDKELHKRVICDTFTSKSAWIHFDGHTTVISLCEYNHVIKNVKLANLLLLILCVWVATRQPHTMWLYGNLVFSQSQIPQYTAGQINAISFIYLQHQTWHHAHTANVIYTKYLVLVWLNSQILVICWQWGHVRWSGRDGGANADRGNINSMPVQCQKHTCYEYIPKACAIYINYPICGLHDCDRLVL